LCFFSLAISFGDKVKNSSKGLGFSSVGVVVKEVREEMVSFCLPLSSLFSKLAK